MRATSLYISYGGLLDPLIQAQVVGYLEGLAKVGYHPILLTFEQQTPSDSEVRVWRRKLRKLGITWHWLRYHKRPTVPATLWDILSGITVGLFLAQRYRVSLLHARAHIPAIMALGIKKLAGRKLLFDIRGLNAEEAVDAGSWPANGLLFRSLKKVERLLMREADGFVVLTGKAHDALRGWYPREMAGKPIEVIPCCVDLRQFPAQARSDSDASGQGPVKIVYLGKLGGRYLSAEMVRFFSVAAQKIPDLTWQVWTQSDSAALQQLIAAADLADMVAIKSVDRADLAVALAGAQAGLSFLRPASATLASSPTKIGEYLAAGLPVVSSAGIGDVDELLRGDFTAGFPVGVLLNSFDDTAYDAAAQQLALLLRDAGLADRCRALAAQQLGLEQVGWTRYRRLYRRLLQPRSNAVKSPLLPGAGKDKRQ